MNPPSTRVPAHVGRPLQPGAAPHLGAFLDHHDSVAHVEHHAGLDHGAKADEVRRIAEHDGALGHARRRRGAEVGAVGRQQPLERGDQVVRAAEEDTVHLQPRPLVVGPLPMFA
jgi:hypothetical protein